MNKAAVVLISTSIIGAICTVGAFKLGRSNGQKDAINELRQEQLDQAREEREEKGRTYEGPLGQPAHDFLNGLDAWLKEEERAINEMYDEIINNL